MTLPLHQLQIIEEVRALIDKRFKKHIPIADLVSKYNISETALTKGFKNVYHKTIYHYRLEKSMEYAKSMIESGVPVKALTKELGYKNYSSFSRAFKKIYFKIPSKYLPHYVSDEQMK